MIFLQDAAEKMFKEVAIKLNFHFTQTRAGYFLSDNETSFGLIIFLDKKGKLVITLSSKLSNKPFLLGKYTLKDFEGTSSKAEKELTAKLLEGRIIH